MNELAPCSNLSLLSHVDDLHTDSLSFGHLQVVHSPDSLLSFFRVRILDEGVAFADTRLWISMDIHVVNLSKRLKKIFEITFGNICQFVSQTTHNHFCLTTDLLLLLLNRIGGFYNSHLSTYIQKLLCDCCSSVLFGLRVLHPQSTEVPSLQLKRHITHGQCSLN